MLRQQHVFPVPQSSVPHYLFPNHLCLIPHLYWVFIDTCDSPVLLSHAGFTLDVLLPDFSIATQVCRSDQSFSVFSHGHLKNWLAMYS